MLNPSLKLPVRFGLEFMFYLILSTLDSNTPERNRQPKSGSTRHSVVHSSSLGNGQASANASTRTQHGSLAMSDQDTEGVPTPFSYTGHTVDGASFTHHGDSEARNPATNGSGLGDHTILIGDLHSKMDGWWKSNIF